MVSEEQVMGDRSVSRQRRRGIGGRRWWAGNEVAATPSLAWKHREGDSVGGAVAVVSARQLAASLWHLAAPSKGGGSVRWQFGLSFDWLGFEFCSSAPIPKFANEGVTKWDYCNSKAWDDVCHFQSSTGYTRDADSFKAQKRVDEADRGWSRTKNEGRASCLTTEGHNMSSVIKNLSDGAKRERKNCIKMDMMNSKLQRDIAEAKSSAKRFVRNLGKEKKAREDLEDMCENLAKEIEGNKVQIGALMNQQKRIELEVEEERKMLQLAEVWREEQVQMKIADAKLILEDKYAEISNLITDLKAFLRRLHLIGDVDVMSKARALTLAFDSVNIQRVKNFSCRLPKSNNRVAIIKDSQSSEAKRSGNHCFSHDQAHNGSSEISSVSLMLSKKRGSSGSKIQRAWSRSKDTCKNMTINGSSDRSVSSTVSMASPEVVPGERQVEVQRNPHVVRAMKGHIEWPRGIPRRGLTANRLKAKFESQKTLLHNVLEQRI